MTYARSSHPVPRVAVLALGLAAAACGGRSADYDRSLLVSSPIVVGRHLAYLDQGRERVTLVRPVTGEVRHVPVGRRPAFILPAADGARALVVCKGWVARERSEVDEAPSLHVVDARTGETAVHRLGQPFDEVALSPDGRWAVAFFSATAQPGPDEVLRNPNAVAILDLEATGADVQPREKTVRSFGDVPLGVVFSPPTMAPIATGGGSGDPRTLAVVFAAGYVTFLDVTAPDRSEVTVHLTLPGQGQTVIPEEMVFAPDSGTIFLRAAGANDIYAFTLAARTPPTATANDFVISVNTLAAGTTPGDVAFWDASDGRKILVANQGSRDLTVIDAPTSQFVNLPVGDPVDRLILWPPVAPTVAVAFSQASQRSRIHFLDLGDVEARGTQNLDVLETNDPVANIVPIPGRDQALVLHASSSGVLSVLDLAQRTLSPLTAHGSLAGYVFTSTGTTLAGFTAGWSQLGLIQLDHLSVRTLQLGSNPLRVLALAPPAGEAADAETAALVVDHGDLGGRLTVVPYPEVPDRSTSFVLSGFLLGGLLGEAE
jgi:hypothetical protein